MSSSWFSLSLPNPFNSDDEQSPPQSPTTAGAGKPDFSGLTQTIGRQLHNVASFLAPPPQPSSSSSPPVDDSGDDSLACTDSYRGIKNDLAEIGGSFKTSLSLLSSNKAVSGISKFASNLLQFDERDDPGEVKSVGITDEIIAFVREISVRPECWIDFPLSLQHEDFNMSDIHKDHATKIEQLVPSVTDLRHKIKSLMSEEQFWIIYFILLLPRLNEDDYRLLSTPEIIQVREILLQKLRNKNKPVNISDHTRDENHQDETSNGTNTIKTENHKSSKSSQEHHNDEVSSSDLEDEDNDLSSRISGMKQSQSSNRSSSSETGDWVRLNETSGSQSGEQKVGKSTYRERRSESEESSDWLDVEDVDL